MLGYVGLALLALVVALLVYAATRPDHYRVERRARIDAPPAALYPLLADFRRWPEWSPWEKLDPDMRRTLEGAEMGKGAVYRWEGNRRAGAGRMEIVDAAPPSRIIIQLEFTRPFASRNTTEFTLQGSGDGTIVTWLMHGPSPFLSRVFGIFLDLDAMIGKDFEQGLANLKRVAQGY